MKELVYKYRPLSPKNGDGISDIDKVLDILENNRLFFPNRSQLNDPLEGIIQPIYYATMGSSYYIENGILQPEFRHILSEYKILSLSRYPDIMQMWAHYANNYCGVCIGFDLKEVEDELKKVKYTKKKFKPIDIDRTHNQEKIEAEVVYNNFLYKSYFWRYENELRIIKKTRDMFYELPADSIKCVVLGNVLEIDSDYIERIVRICSKKNIKIFRTVIAVDRFGITIEPFDIEEYRNGDYDPYHSNDLFMLDGKSYNVKSYYGEDDLHYVEFPDELFEKLMAKNKQSNE